MDERSGIQNSNDFKPHLSPFAHMALPSKTECCFSCRAV
jgi:hypothetical protein